jgi:hypothetical protein
MNEKKLNGVDILQGLMKAYRDALSDGVPSNAWIRNVRVLLEQHGETLVINPEDLVSVEGFLTYVANMESDTVYVRSKYIKTSTILLAVNQWQRDHTQYDSNGRTYLEDIAHTQAEIHIGNSQYDEVAKRYAILREKVIAEHELNRFTPFEALDGLRRAIQQWVNNKDVIDTSVF